MRVRDFIPPVVSQFAGAVLRSLSSDFVRGRDIDDDVRKQNRLSEPFAQSAWIRSAVNYVANPISGREVKFYDGDREIEDPKLADWWANPAVGPRTLGKETSMPIAEVMRDLASWDRYEGEFFLVVDPLWLLVGANRRASALPRFLIPNPQRMQIVVAGNELIGWRYVDAGGQQHSFVPQQVIHRKSWNPHDDWRGVGGLQAARVAAEGAFLTGTYMRDLAKNNGDQGMVVVAKSGVVTDPQREQVISDLRAKRAALLRGTVKDLFLSGDITIDRPKEQAASAELMTSKAMTHEEIYVAFEVPPSLAAVKQSYSIGKESDKYQLITETCMPVGNRIASAFAELASIQMGRKVTAELDWDDHPVMVEVRNSRIDSAFKLWGVGMPIKDANDYLGLGMKPFAGWEVGYLPFSVAPVDSGADMSRDPAADPQLAEPSINEDPAITNLRLLVLARSRKPACAPTAKSADPFAAFACSCHGDAGVSMKARSEREIAQWRTLMAKRRDTVQSFRGAFGRVLMAARRETLAKLEGTGTKAITKAAVADFIFDLAKFTEGFLGAMRNQHRSALETAGKQLFAEVGKDDPFLYPAQEVLNFLTGRENKLRDVPGKIHEEIKAELEAGIVAGDTTAQLATRVRTAFNGVSSERALRIAMTETAAAYGAGRDEAMVQAGIQWKRWLTSGNSNVRAAHAGANGQTVRIDEAFEVGGEYLMFPGDDAGSAANVINCHCVSVASSEGPSA